MLADETLMCVTGSPRTAEIVGNRVFGVVFVLVTLVLGRRCDGLRSSCSTLDMLQGTVNQQ